MAVVDSISNENLSAQATVTVTQLSSPFASATGSLETPPLPTDLAANRAGPYRIEVSVQAYQTWIAEVVVKATEDDCAYVITTQITARMMKS